MMKAPLVHIQVERDVMHKPCVRVFPHEIPILQAIHGPEKIVSLKGKPEESKEFDPALQYGVLMRSMVPIAVEILGSKLCMDSLLRGVWNQPCNVAQIC